MQSLQLHISYQMRPYSGVNVILELIYTCFRVIGLLREFWEIGPKKLKKHILPQSEGYTEKIPSVQFHISRQLRAYSSRKAIWRSSYKTVRYIGLWGSLGKLGPNTLNHGQGEIHRKSWKVFNSTFHIKCVLTQV